MSDVSCRAFSFLQAAEAAGICDIDELLVGVGVPRATLEDARARVSWDVWAELSDRFAAKLGSRKALLETGRFIDSPGFIAHLKPIFGLIVDPRELYRLGFNWVGPSLYRCVAFSVEDAPRGALRLRFRLREGYRPSEGFFGTIEGVLRVLPHLIGMSDAEVVGTYDSSSADYVVVPPAKHATRGIVRRIVGAVRGAGTISRELTEQQRQLTIFYESMHQAEASFRTTLETLPALVGVLAQGTARLLYANPALRRVLGEKGAARGSDLSARVPPEDAGRFDEMCRMDASRAPRPLRLLRPDGATVEVEAVVVPGTRFEDEPACVFFATDVSARKLAEQSLERTEATLHAVLQVMPDLFLRVTSDGRILEVQGGQDFPQKSALAQLTGSADQDAVRRVVSELSPEQFAAMSQAFERATTSGETQHRDLSIGADAGERSHYDVRFIPVVAAGEVVIIVRDMTQRKREEQQLATAERVASLGALAAGLGHEINNPLTYILTNLELLGESLARAERGEAMNLAEMREIVADSVEGGRRVAEIVKSLRLFSRSDQLTIEEADVESVVEAALRMTTKEIAQRARLVRRSGDVPRLRTDAARLQQVLVNLLLNAAQAIPEGAPARNEVRVTTSVEPDGIVIEVEDTGIGIPPEAMPHVFDPFFTTKSNPGGTGLGLSICHRIVKELGGELALQSVVDRGTRVRVTIPTSERDQVHRSTVHPRVEEDRDAERPTRVLVVDDEELVTAVFVRVLATNEVKAVTSAASALEWLASGNDPDVILCDLMMPGMSGVELYERVVAARPELEPRFLFISGGAFTPRTREFADRHPGRTLEKPVAPDALRSAVAAVASTSRIAAAASRAARGA